MRTDVPTDRGLPLHRLSKLSKLSPSIELYVTGTGEVAGVTLDP